ncbi:hypothetical protein LCGC14_2879530, partial [marine sediment metagenome]
FVWFSVFKLVPMSLLVGCTLFSFKRLKGELDNILIGSSIILITWFSIINLGWINYLS